MLLQRYNVMILFLKILIFFYYVENKNPFLKKRFGCLLVVFWMFLAHARLELPFFFLLSLEKSFTFLRSYFLRHFDTKFDAWFSVIHQNLSIVCDCRCKFDFLSTFLKHSSLSLKEDEDGDLIIYLFLWLIFFFFCSDGARTCSADWGCSLPRQLPRLDADCVRGSTDQVHAHDAGRRGCLPHQGMYQSITLNFYCSRLLLLNLYERNKLNWYHFVSERTI